METGGLSELRAAIDGLARAEIVGLAQRDDLVGLWRELARLEAQLARRVAELDRSGWLVSEPSHGIR
jgi:hypothetical protein